MAPFYGWTATVYEHRGAGGGGLDRTSAFRGGLKSKLKQKN